ncbi:MAG: ABC transporter ATP-binding protein [Candidatus Saccharibacteria bacterium]|nr:ABC transporter ATP-binding protein [Candidatus Saccharibacteria bacterium]
MRHFTETIKTIMEIAPGKRFEIAQLFVSIGLYTFADLLPPLATSAIIAVLTDGGEYTLILLYAVLYVVFYVIRYACYNWNYYVYVKLSTHYYGTIQQLLFEHVANHEKILDKISFGKISDTCSEDVSQVVYAIDSASIVATSAIQLIIIFIVFAFNNVFAALAALFVDGLYIYIMVKNAHSVSKYYEGTRKYQDKCIDILNQMLGNLRQVKSLNLMPNLNKKLGKARDQYSDQYKKKYDHLILRDCRFPMIIHIGKIALYLIFALLVMNGQMTIDKLVLLISYFEMVISSSNTILSELLELDQYAVRINRIKHILDYSSKNQIDYDGDIENDYINGVVVFDHVFYTADGKKILNNVSFKALPNEITAIVGRPGAGKTTIINLLYRLFRVKSGSILIDDESVYNYSKRVYSKNVSGVFQKSFVFKMSIRDNLSLVDPNINHQNAALRRVGLYDTVQRLPYGINTVIDNSESVLTNGQLQKLAIARALLSGAEILLFDEVTSSIDPASTKDIIEILKDLKEDHTIIIITHKPEIMELADQVVVMKDGKVIAKGDNKSVFEKSAHYRELRTAIFAVPSLNDEYNHPGSTDSIGYSDADIEEPVDK